MMIDEPSVNKIKKPVLANHFISLPLNRFFLFNDNQKWEKSLDNIKIFKKIHLKIELIFDF